jgi:uncharacterized protein (TIGR03067 family)
MPTHCLGVLLACALFPPPPAGALKALQGAWRLTALEADGRPIELDEGQRGRVVIRGDRLTADDGEHFSVKVDAAARPPLIDLTRLTGEDQGAVLEGVYRLEGGTLTVCVFGGEGVRSRPTEFGTGPGSGRVLFVLRREGD